MAREVVFGVADQVLAGFVRLVTNPRIFSAPTRMSEALDFGEWLREQPNAQPVRPGKGHWRLFCETCRRAEVRGAQVTDAWYAALAIEQGCVWVTADRDFARYPGLLWRHPLDDDAIRENPR